MNNKTKILLVIFLIFMISFVLVLSIYFNLNIYSSSFLMGFIPIIYGIIKQLNSDRKSSLSIVFIGIGVLILIMSLLLRSING